MVVDYENPFASFGGIVYGERFIGRQSEINVVENRVVRPSDPGSLAIIGDHRIGKSSLAYKVLIENKVQLHKKRYMPIWLNLATYDDSKLFFRALVARALDELTDLNWINESLVQAGNVALDDKTSWTDGYYKIQRFFEKLKTNGIRTIFILDEFDHARYLFKSDISGFQGLRELAYQPAWKVSFVIVSRRSIHDIEIQTRAISTLDNILLKVYLGMFNEDEFAEYIRKLRDLGLDIDETIEKKIEDICGFHPYLLDLMGYDLVESYFSTKGNVSVEQSTKNLGRSFLDQYDRMTGLLTEEGLLTKLIQVLFGPTIDVSQSDLDQIERLGLIQLDNNGYYQCFSGHFSDYLRLIERQFDLWPLWRSVEQELRSLIVLKMTSVHGSDWITRLEKARPNLKTIFDACRQAQSREIQSFGSRASGNLIDFTYPMDLWAIISSDWNSFKVVLGKDKNYWQPRMELLSKIRNPLAHNRDVVLQEHERVIADGYCKEIIATLNKPEKI